MDNFISGTNNTLDQSTEFNFSDCNLFLQGHLNELSTLLSENNSTEVAAAIKDAADKLKPVEECSDKKEVKRSGALNSVKRIIDQLEDEKSMLNKAVKGVKSGVAIAKDIIKAYNAIHGWMG
jgi:hypothetical protein